MLVEQRAQRTVAFADRPYVLPNGALRMTLPPADAGDDHAERRVRENRVRFWTRCGAVPLPVPGYVMPPVTVAAAPEPVLLMAAAAGLIGVLPVGGGRRWRLRRAGWRWPGGWRCVLPAAGGAPLW